MDKNYKYLYQKYKKKYLLAKKNHLLGGLRLATAKPNSKNSNELKLLYKDQSKFQKIRLYQKNNDFWLTLNDQIQFHSKEYKISHTLQAVVPVKKYKPKKILILGGGDCINAAFILKFPFVESVTLVEIDQKVIDMVRETDIMKKITNNVLDDERLNIIIGDATEFVFNCKEKYDFIIDDVEYGFTNQPNKDIDFFQYMKKKLSITDTLTFVMPDSNIIDEKQNYKKEFPAFYKIYEKKNKNLFEKKNLNNLTPSDLNKLDYDLYTGNIIDILKEVKFPKSFLKKLENDNILQDFKVYLSAYEYGIFEKIDYGFEMYFTYHRVSL